VDPDTELSTILSVLARAADDGSPVATASDRVARLASRRFHSSAGRGIAAHDRDARVRDLASGLIHQLESRPELVGPLKRDYQHLATLIVDALLSDAS
jgi:hypothetical protein